MQTSALPGVIPAVPNNIAPNSVPVATAQTTEGGQLPVQNSVPLATAQTVQGGQLPVESVTPGISEPVQVATEAAGAS